MDVSLIPILNAGGVIFLVTFICLFLYIKRKQNYWSQKAVPHVEADSLIYGNLKEVMLNKGSLFHKYLDIYRRFEDEPYCGLYEFHNPVLMIRDPQLIQNVLIENSVSFENWKIGLNQGADEIFSYNPFVIGGKRWKDYRAIIAGGLTPNKLRILEDIAKAVSQEMFEYLDNNSNDIEVNEDLISKFNSELVATFGWGIKSNGFSSKSAIKKAFDLMSYSSTSSFDDMILNPIFSRIRRLRLFPKELCDCLRSITEQASISAKNSHYNLLQHLLITRDKSRNKDMSMAELAGHMGTFFLDAYETCSRVLSYAIYRLMLHPDMQTKVREEIMKVDEEITIEGVSKLQYMEMFLSEVLRYHPVFIYLGRLCTKNCKLGSLDVEEGTGIIIPLFGIYNDPNIYPEPEIFDPEHFSEDNKNKRHKYTFLPFGQGPRMCLGNRYALANMKLVLFYLLRHYEVVPPKDHIVHKVEYDPKIKIVYNSKEPLYVRFKKIA